MKLTTTAEDPAERVRIDVNSPRAGAVVTSTWRRLVRYCWVTMITLPLGQGAQAVMLSRLDWTPVRAACGAFVVMVGPGYVLNRYWVWGRRTPNSFRKEIFPYWAFAVAGFAVALVVARALTENVTSTAGLVLASIGAYSSVWLARFAFLERVLFRQELQGSE